MDTYYCLTCFTRWDVEGGEEFSKGPGSHARYHVDKVLNISGMRKVPYIYTKFATNEEKERLSIQIQTHASAVKELDRNFTFNAVDNLRVAWLDLHQLASKIKKAH